MAATSGADASFKSVAEFKEPLESRNPDELGYGTFDRSSSGSGESKSACHRDVAASLRWESSKKLKFGEKVPGRFDWEGENANGWRPHPTRGASAGTHLAGSEVFVIIKGPMRPL